MKNIFTFLALMVFLSGCSSVAYIKTNDSPEASTQIVSPNAIKAYATDKSLKSTYEILGEVVVAADAGNSTQKVVDLLKKQASELGADAIINLRLEYEYGYWSVAMKGTGTAVKLK
jgi:uncharacterized protein YbjQ (UPF0145 family)